MATVNYKLLNPCSGADHVDIDMTPGPTVRVEVGDFRLLMDKIAAMSNKEKGMWHLAFHAVVNDLTLAQLRNEVTAVNGLDLTA